MRRIGAILAVAVLLSMTWLSTANAAPGWFKVTVDSVGMQTVNTLGFRLTHVSGSPEFTFKRFMNISDLKKEFLATALNTMAADLPLFVFTDPDDGTVPEVLQLFLTK